MLTKALKIEKGRSGVDSVHAAAIQNQIVAQTESTPDRETDKQP
jgi:hypothetical protein